MVDLSAQQFLGGVHDPFAARHHAVDGVAWMVPEGQARAPALAVVAAVGMLVERAVLARGASQQGDFIAVEHAAGKNEAVLVISAHLLV